MAKKKHAYTSEIKPKKGFIITSEISKVSWTTGMEHYVDLPHGFKDKHIMKLWCEQNCLYPVAYFDDRHCNRFVIRNFDNIKSSARVFFFSEEDAVAFKLRWI